MWNDQNYIFSLILLDSENRTREDVSQELDYLRNVKKEIEGITDNDYVVASSTINTTGTLTAAVQANTNLNSFVTVTDIGNNSQTGVTYTIVGTASDLEADLKNDVIKFSASGFRDFTRIAASDPIMWRDVFLNNSEAVLEMLQRFNEDLSDLQKAIRKKQGQKLHSFFSRTRSIRKKIIEAGQI